MTPRFSAPLALAVAATLAATGPAASAPETNAPPVSLPSANAYFKDGQATLSARRSVKPNTRKAKNVILFLADGMDPTTVAAARIFDGQSRGEEGEENYLSFERFSHLAMAKTYTTDAQTPDSAGTMSAIVTGVKTRSGVLSISADAEPDDCKASIAARVATLGELAEVAGLATGVISTARLTHATPAAVYAHSPNRDWESDADLPAEAKAEGCADIAGQLIDFPYGDGIDVAFGGGRAGFLPETAADPEDEGATGRRKDGRDLTAEWSAKSAAHVAVFDRAGFDALDPKTKPRPLGLFERTHMEYEADRAADAGGEPSLAEMTAKAIDILSRDRDGYFLMVEGGRVDHAHHAGNAARALRDTQAFAEAVAAALDKVDLSQTLIVVTADHGHTLAFQGYPSKGNDILGLTDAFYGDGGAAVGADGKPYTTLSYANGPGSPFLNDGHKAGRPVVTADEAAAKDYRQQAIVPMGSETHGGQDVTIYAEGPHAYLFGGVVEQNYIFHVIEAALDLRKRAGVK